MPNGTKSSASGLAYFLNIAESPGGPQERIRLSLEQGPGAISLLAGQHLTDSIQGLALYPPGVWVGGEDLVLPVCDALGLKQRDDTAAKAAAREPRAFRAEPNGISDQRVNLRC